ncbi:MAG: phasin family protein [Casimicrobiaceae bacterium]
MQKQMTFGNNGNPISDAAFAASRQVWLAGLGAAAVTREWARTEAGKTFRTLVKHGSTVENRAIRVLGDRIETSIANATSIWKQTRATVMTTAGTLAETANAALSQFKAPTVTRKAPAKPRKAVKTTKKRAARTTRGVKRARKA